MTLITTLKQTYAVVRKVRKSGVAFESTVLGDRSAISPPPNIGSGATSNYGDLALAAINSIGDGIKVSLPDSATRPLHRPGRHI